MNENVAYLVEKFKLKPHPEGGFYSETYRATKSDNGRSWSTGIYFLLGRGDISHLHRIDSDEMWHFYSGDPLKIIEIDEEGKLVETILGTNYKDGMVSQYTVKAGRWFCSLPVEASEYCFVGCTVSPGFEFSSFELAKREVMSSQYPEYKDLMTQICID